MAMFLADLLVWFYCVQVYGFLGASENSRKIYRKSTYQKLPPVGSGARGRPRGALCALRMRPPPWPRRGRLGWSHTPWCLTWPPIFTRRGETPEQKPFLRSTSRSRRHPLFFLGRANLEAALASGEGKSSPSSSPSPLHHPSMTSSLMCE